jgi:hypothetical protein
MAMRAGTKVLELLPRLSGALVFDNIGTSLPREVPLSCTFCAALALCGE